jgi:hypothetical protein
MMFGLELIALQSTGRRIEPSDDRLQILRRLVKKMADYAALIHPRELSTVGDVDIVHRSLVRCLIASTARNACSNGCQRSGKRMQVRILAARMATALLKRTALVGLIA